MSSKPIFIADQRKL